jgi:peptidoglycan/xylan/chitin deacetylase (PgdA/CDA1 family)
MIKVRHLAKYLFCVCFYYSGIVFLARITRRWRRKFRLVILAYHSFSDNISYLDMAVPPSLFRKQLRYLCRVFTMQTLSNALQASQRAAGLQRDTAVITVDDGYADNFHPLVEAAVQFGAPSTLYVTTNCIDARQATTVMWVMLAVHYSAAESLDLSEFGLGVLSIQTPREKESAVREIDGSLKPLSNRKRQELIELLIERTGRADIVRWLGHSAMLQWEELRQMHSTGVEIGAHTLTHPLLTCLDASAVHDEIVLSLRRVAEMVGVERASFAYPYGGQSELNTTVVEICRNSGASSAVMLINGEMPGRDLFTIPRVMVTSDRSTSPSGHFSRAVWACELEGFVDIARKLMLALAGLATSARASCEIHE